MRPLRDHSYISTLKRLRVLARDAGFITTLTICAAELEEHLFGMFDRRYGIKTSGYISLATTSFAPGKLKHASAYRPVNAWSLARLLDKLALPKRHHFADLGCGLGRACILAAEHGFARVTGVELALELCELARKNLTIYRSRNSDALNMEILHQDVLDYCEHTEADVFFMYRPFSGELLHWILDKLEKRSVDQGKTITIIYCENLHLPEPHSNVFSLHQAYRLTSKHSFFGFSFFVYRCGRPADGPAGTNQLSRQKLYNCIGGKKDLDSPV